MALGIVGLAGIHQYVHDLEESRRFYVDGLGFDEIGRSSGQLERAGRQRSLVFRCGDVVVTCSAPLGTGGRAWRYLSRHPEGVGAVAFEVADVEHAFSRLEANGATPISDVLWQRDEHGRIGTFSITTPLGDTTFRFIERRGHRALFPGMETYDIPRAGAGHVGALHVDHITANFRTMKPALLWLEHVLELKPFWDVEFHTQQANAKPHGSGLRSRVMWDPGSGLKLASNEPLRPAFHRSQIELFCDDNRGDGVQHVALAVSDIKSAVRRLKQRGVQLMPPLPGYREQLARHLPGAVTDAAELLELGILVDAGTLPEQYLLQIFLKEAALQHGRTDAGPFFFELIQRHGAAGFGEGNFKALFDGIATQQVARVG